MKKNDLIFIGIIFVAIFVVMILMKTVFLNNGEVVEILIDGKLQETFSLEENQEYMIETKGDFNKLIIEDGKAYIEDASCPDRLCVQQKSIKLSGESLICLPNKVVVRISGKSTEIDAFAN